MPASLHYFFGRNFVAGKLQIVGSGADKRDAVIDAGIGKRVFFSQVTVSWMNRLRMRLLGRVDDAVDVQIAFCANARTRLQTCSSASPRCREFSSASE